MLPGGEAMALAGAGLAPLRLLAGGVPSGLFDGVALANGCTSRTPS